MHFLLRDLLLQEVVLSLKNSKSLVLLPDDVLVVR